MVRNDQEARGKVKQVACHLCRWCIPAYCGHRDCAFRHEWPQALVCLGLRMLATPFEAASKTGVIRQFMTNMVSLCANEAHAYERQEVGKYLRSTVLDAHVHWMLPASVTGDSTTYLVLARIASLALGPLNRTLITPSVTSTLDTY